MMTEPEILLQVQCPQCGQHSLSEFRLSVVAEAIVTRQLRLYAQCHVASWDASDIELDKVHSHLDALWSDGWQFACADLDAARQACA
jgi:hypothetical protein